MEHDYAEPNVVISYECKTVGINEGLEYISEEELLAQKM